jgi:hypothetical protein
MRLKNVDHVVRKSILPFVVDSLPRGRAVFSIGRSDRDPINVGTSALGRKQFQGVNALAQREDGFLGILVGPVTSHGARKGVFLASINQQI